jgi:hypothetical protein
MNKIYAVEVCTFASDVYGETYIDSYWDSKDKAETRILQANLLEKSYNGNNAYVIEIELNKSLE